jgi:hypothetical protein
VKWHRGAALFGAPRRARPSYLAGSTPRGERMNKPDAPTRWYSRWRAAPAAPRDFADLGTAFGLDCSLGTPLPMPVPAAAPPAGVRRWMRRLGAARQRAG